MFRAFLCGLAVFFVLGISGCVKTQDDESVTEHNRKVDEANEAIRKANAEIRAINDEESDIARDKEDTFRAGTHEHYLKLKERYQGLDRRYARLNAIISKDMLNNLRSLKEYKLYDQFIQIRNIINTNQSLNYIAVEAIEIRLLAMSEPRSGTGELERLRSVNGPLVSANDGGYIRGVVRDSVTGAVVKDATVGFREPDKSDYFYQTNTGQTGAYISPALRPGTYAMDVRQNGYVISRNAHVEVSRGQVAQENVSLTQPLENGVYRITMSWTGPKSNAVRDVDSYLKIPGVVQPLYYGIPRQDYYGSHLDRDEQQWNGPETVTIKKVYAGTYRYFVNNYSHKESPYALGESAVRVQVYYGDRIIRSYAVPAGRGFSYELFRIVDGRLEDVENYDDSLLGN